MLSNIATFVKSLLPSFSRNDIESDMEVSLESIATIQSLFESLQSTETSVGFQHKANKKVVDTFIKECKGSRHKVKLTNKYISKDICTLFTNIKENGNYLYDEISDTVNDVIISNALSAYKANLLAAVSHYDFITRYALDLANYIVYQEQVQASKSEYEKDFHLNKKQIEYVEKNLWIFVRAICIYGESPTHFKDKLDNISNISLPKEEVDSVIDGYTAHLVNLCSNLPNNFVGSPIYSLRLPFAEWTASRYRKLQDQKKLFELRLIHLKLLKEQGMQDSNCEKEIASLQDRITEIDYEIAKIEKDI